MDDRAQIASRRGRLVASPRARRAIRRLGIDPTSLQGSGPHGRIVEADLQPASLSQLGSTPVRTPGISMMRRMIAQRTTHSFSTVPHFYLRAELDATGFLQRRDQLLRGLEHAAGVRLSITDFLLQATALALQDCPQANSIWQDNTIVRLPTIDLGLVIGLEDGLIIPIIRQADRLDLSALAKERSDLVTAARSGKLDPERLQGGATSISNLGAGLVDEFSAIISPPQSSILAAGRIAPRPFVLQDQICIRPTLKLCLSVDHRVMDGGPAASFLAHIIDRLVNPPPTSGAPPPQLGSY